MNPCKPANITYKANPTYWQTGLPKVQTVDYPAYTDNSPANLDLATESRVTAAMQRVARDRTTIVIAHRLQTARGADRIAVLDAGRVSEIGTHDELIEGDGGYARMWRAFETVDLTSA